MVTDIVIFEHKYITWTAVTHGGVVCRLAFELSKALQGKPIMKKKE